MARNHPQSWFPEVSTWSSREAITPCNDMCKKIYWRVERAHFLNWWKHHETPSIYPGIQLHWATLDWVHTPYSSRIRVIRGILECTSPWGWNVSLQSTWNTRTTHDHTTLVATKNDCWNKPYAICQLICSIEPIPSVLGSWVIWVRHLRKAWKLKIIKDHNFKTRLANPSQRMLALQD
jgi:hypothetical protein